MWLESGCSIDPSPLPKAAAHHRQPYRICGLAGYVETMRLEPESTRNSRKAAFEFRQLLPCLTKEVLVVVMS